MDIEVGEYIRTKDGFIRKIDKIDRCSICKEKEYISDEFIEGLHFQNTYHKKDIVKHSKNIIDLIEVGDWVNYRKVQQVFIDPFTKKKRLEMEGKEINWQGDMSCFYCESEDIKSIVTKEQFKNMEYKVGD